MDELAEFSRMNDNVDFAGRIVWKDVTDKDGNVLLDENGKPRRHEVFNFGKYRGWDVAEVLHRDPGFYSWMLASDFTYNTKQSAHTYSPPRIQQPITMLKEKE